MTYWGNIRALDDLTNIFLNYLKGKLAITPFSQGPLSPESLMIMTHLERLTKKTWWTVGSQPAVDGALSSDSVVGWGPKGGYVFQKSFVEFFCEEKDVDLIEQRARQESAPVHWLAGNNEVRAPEAILSSALHCCLGPVPNEHDGGGTQRCHMGCISRARNCANYNN